MDAGIVDIVAQQRGENSSTHNWHDRIATIAAGGNCCSAMASRPRASTTRQHFYNWNIHLLEQQNMVGKILIPVPTGSTDGTAGNLI
jgi:hypothetical protein